MANRFTQPAAPARFSPLTFEEQSFAPLMLRAREDQMMNARDAILQEMANLQVPGMYQGMLDETRAGLESELNNLADRIQKEGAGNLNYLSEFRNLRNKYNQQVSASGNIGRAVGAKAGIDAMQSAYMQDALAKGQPAEAAIRNFNAEVNKYLGGLPSDLDQFKGDLPAFMPEFAPNNVGVFESMGEASKLLTGAMEEIEGDFWFEQADDGSIYAVNNEGRITSNSENLEALTNFMQSTLLNPDSDLNRNLRWRQGDDFDPQSYLKDIENLANMQKKYASANVQKYAGTVSKAAPGLTGTQKKEKGAHFQRMANGIAKVAGSFSSASIKEERANIQNDPTLSDEEKAQRTHIYNLALQDKYLLENDLVIRNGKPVARTDGQSFKQNMDPVVAEIWGDQGITTYEQWSKFMEEMPSALIETGIKKLESVVQKGSNLEANLNQLKSMSTSEIKDAIEGRVGPDNPAYVIYENRGNSFSLASMYNQEMNKYAAKNKKIEENYETISKELLEPSSYYMLGTEGDDKKLRQLFNEGFGALDYDAISKAGILSIADENDEFELVGYAGRRPNATSTKGGKVYEEFNEDMKRAKSVDFNIMGINDGGLTAPSQLVFDVKMDFTGTTKKNKTTRVAIDLDPNNLNEISKQVLNKDGEYYELMSPQARRIIDGIRDKAEYGNVVTDLSLELSEKGGSPYDDKGTASIKEASKKALGSRNINIRSSDSFIANELFVNPYAKDADYAVMINPDDSYTVQKRVNGESTQMTFNDYATKVGASKAFTDGKTGDYQQDNTPYVKYGKASTLHQLALSAPDLESVEGLVMYNYNPKFLTTLRTYWNEFEGLTQAQLNSPEALDRAAELFDDIANLPVSSRQIKLIL